MSDNGIAAIYLNHSVKNFCIVSRVYRVLFQMSCLVFAIERTANHFQIKHNLYMRKTCLIFLFLIQVPPLMAADLLTAQFPPELTHVDVSLCFSGKAPSYLYRHEDAREYSNGISQHFPIGFRQPVAAAASTTLNLF